MVDKENVSGSHIVKNKNIIVSKKPKSAGFSK
jgi:hypothetical protein